MIELLTYLGLLVAAISSVVSSYYPITTQVNQQRKLTRPGKLLLGLVLLGLTTSATTTYTSLREEQKAIRSEIEDVQTLLHELKRITKAIDSYSFQFYYSVSLDSVDHLFDIQGYHHLYDSLEALSKRFGENSIDENLMTRMGIVSYKNQDSILYVDFKYENDWVTKKFIAPQFEIYISQSDQKQKNIGPDSIIAEADLHFTAKPDEKKEDFFLKADFKKRMLTLHFRLPEAVIRKDNGKIISSIDLLNANLVVASPFIDKERLEWFEINIRQNGNLNYGNKKRILAQEFSEFFKRRRSSYTYSFDENDFGINTY